jgi:hypothetical protein
VEKKKFTTENAEKKGTGNREQGTESKAESGRRNENGNRRGRRENTNSKS